jgi:hypothetical protein
MITGRTYVITQNCCKDGSCVPGHSTALLTSDARIKRSPAPIRCPVITTEPNGKGLT